MSLRINEGYDYQLVNGTPADEYICLQCHLLARDAHQANCCGKIFCRNCLESRRNRSSGYTCPNCLIDTHIRKCPNQVVTSDKRKQKMQGHQLESHIKDQCVQQYYKCVYCHVVGKYDFITGRHQEVCPDAILPCNNEGCQQNIKRCNMELHRQTCPKEIVKCPYYYVGCQEKITREDIDKHEENNTKIHLKKAVEKITDKSHPVSIKLTEFSKHKRLQDEWYSSGFNTSAGEYKLRIKLHANGSGSGKDTHISCSVNSMPGEYDDILEWPFQGEVTVELLNQLEDKNHYKQVIHFNHETPECHKNRREEEDYKSWGLPQFIPHTDLDRNSSTNTQYLMNDTLYFKVSVNVNSKTKPWLL